MIYGCILEKNVCLLEMRKKASDNNLKAYEQKLLQIESEIGNENKELKEEQIVSIFVITKYMNK